MVSRIHTQKAPLVFGAVNVIFPPTLLHSNDLPPNDLPRSPKTKSPEAAEKVRVDGIRREFAPLRAEAKSLVQFLDPSYREDYAYTHYGEVMNEERQRTRTYHQWLDHPDFKAGWLTDDDREKRLIERVFVAKRQLVAFTGGLA